MNATHTPSGISGTVRKNGGGGELSPEVPAFTGAVHQPAVARRGASEAGGSPAIESAGDLAAMREAGVIESCSKRLPSGCLAARSSGAEARRKNETCAEKKGNHTPMGPFSSLCVSHVFPPRLRVEPKRPLLPCRAGLIGPGFSHSHGNHAVGSRGGIAGVATPIIGTGTETARMRSGTVSGRSEIVSARTGFAGMRRQIVEMRTRIVSGRTGIIGTRTGIVSGRTDIVFGRSCIVFTPNRTCWA